jgi:DNA (cytosine-5)-methyltransferase 1
VNELALFAGHGGGILGGCLLGWRTVCAVEIDDAARRRLIARQDDGSLPLFPIWDDVSTFDGKPWAGLVDVISGGFPCQDISVAGTGAGITGERSGLWREFARIIREVRPRYVLVENSPALVARGLGTVLGDLATLGFNARWGVLGAVHAGAPHKRDRIWIVANSVRYRCQADHGRGFVSDQFWQRQTQKAGWELQQSRSGCPGELANHQSVGRGEGWSRGFDSGGAGESKQPFQAVANADGLRQSQPQGGQPNERGWTGDGGGQGGMQWWSAEPDVGRVAHGVADRVDRIRGLGNGQVPAVVALAWETLTSGSR